MLVRRCIALLHCRTRSMSNLSFVPVPHDSPPSVQPSWRTITEGAAIVWYPGPDAVFYNKVQIFNRDLTMAVTRCYDALRHRTATVRDVRKARLRASIRQRLSAESAAAEAAGRPARPLGAAPLVPAVPPIITCGSEVPRGTTGDADASAAGAPEVLPGLRILEALSASGLRSIRYAREVPGVAEVRASAIPMGRGHALSPGSPRCVLMCDHNGGGAPFRPLHC
jgi:tRNA (guanine26-N2/guanine27-N2)-dimethyltransferase